MDNQDRQRNVHLATPTPRLVLQAHRVHWDGSTCLCSCTKIANIPGTYFAQTRSFLDRVPVGHDTAQILSAVHHKPIAVPWRCPNTLCLAGNRDTFNPARNGTGHT